MDQQKTRTILQDLKRDLLQREQAISADLHVALDADGEERATQVENDEVLLQMHAEGRGQITSIDAALERLENGTYGNCSVCGDPISGDRLAAVPYTPFCINCAAALARR
ncbi:MULTISPECIES: TraR/DksA family transcriptional regulator [unclassified Rhizobium]|uniref:TraR/DksA family transcriptional regulator n=1 Tax=Rhizobium sp. Rhizsp82 TaxID=3243057 RepID=UPI001029A499